MLQIIYTSRATVSLDKPALRQMVASANRRNRALGVTGMLYRADDAYLQVLEGDGKTALVWHADILRDERRDHIRTVVIRPIHQRDFANWSMALLEKMTEPVDLADMRNRGDQRVGVWNDAKWQMIVNTFRAELETVEP